MLNIVRGGVDQRVRVHLGPLKILYGWAQAFNVHVLIQKLLIMTPCAANFSTPLSLKY